MKPKTDVTKYNEQKSESSKSLGLVWFVFCFCCIGFGYRASGKLGWPQTLCTTDDGFEFPVLLPVLLKSSY